MMERYSHILVLIAQGYSDWEIEQQAHFSHNTCRKVRQLMKRPEQIFTLQTPLGAPPKVTNPILDRIEVLTVRNRRITNGTIQGTILGEFHVMISQSTITKYRKELGFKFGPPITTFFLTETQVEARLKWAQKEIVHQRDWDRVLFTDESYFVLGEDHRYLWRRPGECGPDVQAPKKKYNTKVLVFGGFCATFKTLLIVMESGTVTSVVYIRDCLGGSQLITGMDLAFGPNQWTLMQDGASAHTSRLTMQFLEDMHVHVLEDWPSGSPDLNPIENLWAIMKHRVSEVNPQTVEQLKEVIIGVWNGITQGEMQRLAHSMPSRLWSVIHAEGRATTDY
jgi:transposase